MNFRALKKMFFFFIYIAHIPLYLYPYLNTTSKTRPFEYLRLTSLGVIGALVKVRREKKKRIISFYITTFLYIIE